MFGTRGYKLTQKLRNSAGFFEDAHIYDFKVNFFHTSQSLNPCRLIVLSLRGSVSISKLNIIQRLRLILNVP